MYNFNKDFRDISTVFVEEELSKEEIMEGLGPLTYEVKLCITYHAYERMFNTVGRGVEMHELERLIPGLAKDISSMNNNNKVILISEDETLAVVGNIEFYEGTILFIVHTVIRVETAKGFKKIRFQDEDKDFIFVA